MNIWHDISPKRIRKDRFYAVIEIQKGGKNKYELDKALQGKQWFFFLVAAAVVIAVLVFVAKLPSGNRYLPLYISMVLLLSGAVGNLIDRAVRGFVVDFFYFSLIDFPIFNVADCYVVCAAGLLILLIGFFYKEDELSFLSSKKGE